MLIEREAEAWSVRMEGYGGPALTDYRAVPLRWTGLAGGRVITARRGQASRSMLFVGRGTPDLEA
jgi:hypothetical protein